MTLTDTEPVRRPTREQPLVAFGQAELRARAAVDRCDLLPAWLRESSGAKSSTEGED